MKKTGGVTLFELLIVAIVIGILLSLGIANFKQSKEESYNKEAKVYLRLIQAAEKEFYDEYPFQYYPPGAPAKESNITNINSNLGLNLPLPGNWNYSVLQSGSQLTSCAERTVNSVTRSWRLNITAENATLVSGGCPAS